MKTFVKWAGGKRQLINVLKEYMPKEFNTYYEPFIDGGALFLEIKPKKAVINDLNIELMDTFKCFQSQEKYNDLITYLVGFETLHNEDNYYKIRDFDRNPMFAQLNPVVKAARFIYLNKAGFNGLYRVNKNGYFNVPFGKKQKFHYLNNLILKRLKITS
ncbi:DNA adenine methylase [Mycoplasmopsis adleri]|uniref:DNA adenine methylase n=1 Tax=Mycoplasmopsis adleri TaxID=51362 RepID=UPI003872DB55